MDCLENSPSFISHLENILRILFTPSNLSKIINSKALYNIQSSQEDYSHKISI